MCGAIFIASDINLLAITKSFIPYARNRCRYRYVLEICTVVERIIVYTCYT